MIFGRGSGTYSPTKTIDAVRVRVLRRPPRSSTIFPDGSNGCV
jgi:hypothetical protein